MRVDALRYFAGGVSIYNEDSTITNVTYGTPPLDTTPPVVTLSGSATVNIEYGNSYVELGASWTDNVDGSGSAFTGTYGAVGSFTLSGTVNTGALGTYMIEYKKVDVAGNSSGAMRTVVVQDTTAPMVTLSGSAIVSIVV